MVLVKKWPFLQLFFRQYRPGKCLLRYFENEKTAFQAINKRSSKGQKIDIFPKGLTHGFVQKWPFFQLFFFYAIQARKMSFTIFQNGKTPFQAINERSSKSWKNCHFCKGVNPWFWSKNGHFSNFFLGNIGQQNVFYDISRTKKRLSRL